MGYTEADIFGVGSPFCGERFRVVKDRGPRKWNPDPFLWHSKLLHLSMCLARMSAKQLGEE